nr:hypothetical protein B0A51_09221 [Rachicladosporium sp. CCFEE 5018]
MCRRNGPRRQPLTVQLAMAAYGAYQSRRTRQIEEGHQTSTKAIEPQYSGPTSEPKYIPEQTLSEAFRGLELQEKGIPPPTYEDVMVNRAELPVPSTPHPAVRSFDKHIDALDDVVSDSESEFEGEVRPAGVKRGDSWKLAKREWKARKAARREEKRMVKAELKAVWRDEKAAWREERRGRARSRGSKLEKILESPYAEVKRTDLDFVARQIDELLKSTTVIVDDSRNVQLLADAFIDTTNLDAFLCGSNLFSRGGDFNKHSAAKTDELRQTSARLHCLYGVPIDETVPSRSSFHMYRENLNLAPSSCTRLQSKPYLTHTFARSKVYDLRQYTEHTLWGPFKDDGSQHVDWEKVESIMVVLGFNLRKFSERPERRFPMIWDEPWVGASPNSYVSQPMSQPTADSPPDDFSMASNSIPSSPSPSLDSQDPYGVTGTWMRVVCFLDYNDLYAFNFSLPILPSEPREPIATEEGMIRVLESWQVTGIEPASNSNPDDVDVDGEATDWSDFKGERLPVVHFQGTSRSLHASWDPNANSKIRERGTERWRSEGIQVGGLRSARGVLGNWFDKDYDMHGPAGPTAFWKESDDLEEE